MANFILKTIDAKVVTLDFPSTGARKSSDIIVPFSGVKTDDFVSIDAKFPPNANFMAWVSGADAVTVRFNNYSGSVVNLSSFSVRLLVLKKEADSIPVPGTGSNIQVITVNGNKTLALTDANNFLDVITASVITVPISTSVNFPLGTVIYINQSATGIVSIAGQAGVTIASDQNAKKLFGQYTQAYLIKLGTNTWQLTGNLKN